MTRIRPHFFIIAFVILISVCYIVSTIQMRGIPAEGFSLEKLEYDTFTEVVSSGHTCILYYNENSDICRRMECTLNHLQNETEHDIKFYKLNVEDSSEIDIPGVPLTVVYNNGNEVKRIMGVVSTSNLRMILNRIDYEYSN